MNRNRSFASFAPWRCLLPACPAILLTAVYLTFLVDLQTLETAMQRVFIFCYFVVMGVLACFLKGKYAEGKPFPLQSRIAAALLAALLVGAGWNTFLPHVRFPLEGSHMYALWEKLLYTLGAWCAVFYFAQLALLFLARPMEKRGWTERQKVLAFLLMGNFVFLFFTSERIQPTHLTQGFLLLLTVASVWCFNRKSGCMEKYRTKGSRAAIGIIAVYASLASFAQRFFLDGNTRMHFSLPGLFYVLSGILWFIPIIRLLLFALEWLSARPRTLPKPGSRKKALCVLLIALLLCQVFVLWVEWPGGFPLDAVYQYRQAMGELPLRCKINLHRNIFFDEITARYIALIRFVNIDFCAFNARTFYEDINSVVFSVKINVNEFAFRNIVHARKQCTGFVCHKIAHQGGIRVTCNDCIPLCCRNIEQRCFLFQLNRIGLLRLRPRQISAPLNIARAAELAA